MQLIETILVKLSGNTKGLTYNMWDWDILSLGEHVRTSPHLTPAERHAKAFLEEVGKVLDIRDPLEKWVKPTGKILNEYRNLH